MFLWCFVVKTVALANGYINMSPCCNSDVKLPPGSDCEVSLSQLCRETILGFVWWSLFTGLVPMIWFYPLNELDITGYEAFAACYLTPLLLGPQCLRRFAQKRWCVAVLRVLVLAALASFQAPTTLQRLIYLAAGCGVLMLQLVTTLWSTSPLQRSLTAWGLLLGFFAYLSARIWFVSFIPTWWDNDTNRLVIAMGALATFGKIASGEDGLVGEEKPLPPSCRPYWLLTGVGFGSVLYITQALFGEVSMVTRWVVKGYPEPGPMPNPWGSAVLVALLVGVQMGSIRGLVTNPLWWLVGCGGLAALLYLPAWHGFKGGLLFAVYLMSIWPEMLDRVTSCPPGRTLTAAMLTYIGLMLFNVWTVAYNFVPGGVYTREHSDWLLAFVAATIGLGILVGCRGYWNSRTSFIPLKTGKMPIWTTSFLLMLIVFSGLSGFASRFHLPPSHPKKEHPHADFTAAIWTYHFGYDNKGWPSLERSASLLNDTGADVITLLESDASKPFLGNNDLGMWLAEKLDMYVDFGPSTRDHTWGNLLLSRYPIVKSTHHLLPSPHGELAPAVTATIDMGGHLVDFVVTHMGNDRDILDRELQAKFLANETKNAVNPAVFLGYVTSQPFSRDYNKLTKGGGMKDIDHTDQDRWCEYILYKKLIRLGYARVSHAGLSDTEVQFARFRIPEDANNYKDHDRIVTDPKQVKAADQFTDKFGTYKDGHNWKQNHHYHMSTPKYFLP